MKKIIMILLFTQLSIFISGQDTFDYLLKGQAFIDAGNQDKAISLFSEAINLKPDYRLYVERATACIKNHDYSSAISDFQLANTIEKNSGSYGLAEVYALKGDVVNSLYNLDIHLGSSNKKDEKTILLDPAFALVENTPEWRLFWKKERYTFFETTFSEIEYELSQGNLSDAESLLNDLITDKPNDRGLLYAKAMIAFAGKKYQETVNLLSPGNASAKNKNELRLLAKAQSAADNSIAAAATYTELIRRETVDANLFVLRAECYRKAGDSEKALSDILFYIELYPENENGLGLAGKIEAESGDNIKALEYFSKNIMLHPALPESYIDRANAYFSSSSWQYAAEDYSMALDLQPGNSEVYLNKGIALINLGKSDDACHDFRQSLQLGNKKASSYVSRYCIK